MGRLHRGRSSGSRRWSRTRSGRTPASSRSSGRTAVRGAPASGCACRPSRRRLETLADDGFDAFYEGDLGERQARPLADVGALITRRRPARPRLDAGATRSRSTTGASGSRPTRRTAPGSSRSRSCRSSRGSRPPAASAFGPDGVTDPAWIHLGIEAAKLAMADRDALPDRPGVPRRPGRAAARPGVRRGAGRAHRPAAGRPTGRRDQPDAAAGRSTSRPSTPTATRSASSSRTTSGSARAWSIRRPASTTRTAGSYFSLDAGPPERPRARASGRSTRCSPGCCSVTASPARGSSPGSMGGDAQPQIHAQLVSALVDGGVDVATAVAAPRWYVEPADHFAPPVDVRLEPRHAPGVAEALEALGHPVTPDRAVRFGPRARARHRAASTADRRPRTARSRPPPTHAARAAGRLVGPVPGCAAAPRSGRLGRSGHLMRYSGPPVAGCAHTKPPPALRPQRCRGGHVTSNVSQNYPYTSETEAERAAGIAAARGRARAGWRARWRPRRRRSATTSAGGSGSARRRAARGSSTPPATPLEKHAVFVVCDGTCAKTFLR